MYNPSQEIPPQISQFSGRNPNRVHVAAAAGCNGSKALSALAIDDKYLGGFRPCLGSALQLEMGWDMLPKLLA